jgi:hypothetical protein
MLNTIITAIENIFSKINNINNYITPSTNEWCVKYVRRTTKKSNETIVLI